MVCKANRSFMQRKYRPLWGLNRTRGKCSLSVGSSCHPRQGSFWGLFSSLWDRLKKNNVFIFDVLSTIPKTPPLSAHQIVIYIIIYVCVLAGRAWLPHIHQTFSSEHQLSVLQSNAIWTLPCDTFRSHTLGLSPSGLFHTVSKSHVVSWQLYFWLVNYKSDSQDPCFGSD